jgi:hypothetical protein
LRTEGNEPTTCNMLQVVTRPRHPVASGSLGAVRCRLGCARICAVVKVEAERKLRGRDSAAV